MTAGIGLARSYSVLWENIEWAEDATALCRVDTAMGQRVNSANNAVADRRDTIPPSAE